MRITLDFSDGNGPVDYTEALFAGSPHSQTRSGPFLSSNIQKNVEAIVIERQRGTYARCHATLDAAGAGLQLPQQGCRVVVTTATGATLFAGTVIAPPQRATALLNQEAPVLFEAVEDAFLANTAIDASLRPVAAKSHAVSFSDNAIVLQQQSASSAAERADDVLVTGAEEPVTYVTELFHGDGTTATFALTAKPFASSGNATLLADSFAGTALSGNVWRLVDTGQHIALGSGGLRIAGGNGFDGQTYLAAQDPVELGGTLCAEMTGVLLQAGSAGVLLGMYDNLVTAPTCFAGLQVNASAGTQTMSALVNGVAVGTAYPWAVGHRYTLRLRLHCAETQRAMATYTALVNGAVESWGGGTVDAPMQLVVEVVDEGLASSTPATVLYAGSVSSSIPQAVFAPVNSQSLLLSAGAITLKQQGSAWVTTTGNDGTVTVRRPGTPNTGEDYRISGTSIEFFSGREPAPGALVTVCYRLRQRAQARLQNPAAMARAQQLGLPGLRTATCRVTEPEPRSAADCAAAAQALLACYADPAYGVRGTCSMPNAALVEDVQPGDTIALPLASTPVNVPVQQVTIGSGHSVPETLSYAVAFAQETTATLSFRKQPGAAEDAALPAPLYAVSTIAALPQLTVTVASASSLQVDAGTTPPVGGGFEVRRHDGGWGPDQPNGAPDSELVLRSPVRSFSVPRSAFAERFYVRMYDGSETPVYSAQSSLLSTHLPVG